MEKAKHIIQKYIDANKRLGVAVSGGRDSMCLLHLILGLGCIAKDRILVINVNHCIRGKESDDDSQFVFQYCKAEGLELLYEVVDIPELSRINGKSLETQAREERRRIFGNLLSNNVVDVVLLAHHQDDQAETILMHIFRGTGLKGLIGMRIYDDRILRPLLTTSSEEIERYSKNHSVSYVQDSTNLCDQYNRNFIRNRIMPLIRQRYKGVNNALSNLSEVAYANQNFIRNSLYLDYIEIDELDCGVIKIDIRCFDSNNYYPEYIFYALEMLKIHADIENKHILAIKALLEGKNGAKINITNDLVVIKEYDKIVICHQPMCKSSPSVCGHQDHTDNSLSNAVALQPLWHSLEDVRQERNLRLEYDRRMICIFPEKQGFEIDLKKSYCHKFDVDKLPTDAIIRTRVAGDIFKPIFGGTKKLKKYLIDKKVPARYRDKIPLIASGNQILLVFGMEVSEEIKLDSTTTKAARAFLVDII